MQGRRYSPNLQYAMVGTPAGMADVSEALPLVADADDDPINTLAEVDADRWTKMSKTGLSGDEVYPL